MKELKLKPVIMECQMEELTNDEQFLLQKAIESTNNSYAKYSHFHVGAAIQLSNGVVIPGCNQENAAFPAGICAERSAIFAAGAQYPDEAVEVIAIAAREPGGELTSEPVSPALRQEPYLRDGWYQEPDAPVVYGVLIASPPLDG